jgi:hypothetical protein
MEKIKQLIENEIIKSNGIIKLNPAWVARNFIAPADDLVCLNHNIISEIAAVFVNGGLPQLLKLITKFPFQTKVWAL